VSISQTIPDVKQASMIIAKNIEAFGNNKNDGVKLMLGNKK
jgi:hypothetical protein